MTQVNIADGKLIVDVQGLHKLWALKSRLEFPLGHVAGVRRAAGVRVKGIRLPGTYIPGLITAGTYYERHEKKAFWDVHNPEKAIAIELRDDRFTRVIVEVVNPDQTVKEIEGAIAPLNA